MPSPRRQTQIEAEPTMPIAERQDPAVRARLSGPALRTFLGIAAEWGLSVDQQRALLGGPAASTYHNWKAGRIGAFSVDQLERLSLVLGIYKALRLLFADNVTGLRWLTAANGARTFAGASPLARMLRGSIDDLYAVRRYLDGWRGGWP